MAVVKGQSSSTLPFGKQVPLSAIAGSTYVTAQLLVQQVAYKLSDKVFSYSPPTFDLDAAAKQWAAQDSTNIHGYAPDVLALQSRTGAGALALGYIFSPDFDVSKRHIPQTLLAASGSLHQLRASLDQLSLLYHLSSPFVAHVAAADYSADSGLVSDYDAALRLVEDLGFAMVASSSAYEAQHMSLLATLLAHLLPTIHIYDGIRLPRETLRVGDALSESGVSRLYGKLAAETGALNQRLDTAGKALELLRLFNDELGTVYAPFEYHGHDSAELVLVAFGSVETQVAKQVLTDLASRGAKVGVVNVRLYRPFIEEAFLAAMPASARTIAVLGQVKDEAALDDDATQSALFGDVLTSVIFSAKLAQEPKVVDIKYTPARPVTPQGLVESLRRASSGGEDVTLELSPPFKAQQFTFWELDGAASQAPSVIGSLLAHESTTNVHLYETHDSLVQGGITRSDLRASSLALEAPYDVARADVAVIGDEKILKEVDVLSGVADAAKILLRLPNFKEAEADKRLPASFRRTVHERGIEVLIVDSSSPALEKDARLTGLLCFLKLALPHLLTSQVLGDLYAAADLQASLDAVEQSLKKLEVPASWAEASDDVVLPSSIQMNAFVRVPQEEAEQPLDLCDWQSAAKALVFKEAYGTQRTLRPDLSVKTFTITVTENRRLTPLYYSRNLFHIEFDVGDSGLTYRLGEALGIHAENDAAQIDDFIALYGLNPSELMRVPSRDDASVLEVRTVHQVLMQNMDILGKPPKRFYEALAEFATDESERTKLRQLGSSAGADEFQRRADVDMLTYVDVLAEFSSARPTLHDLLRIVSPIKRREYSIASAQAITPTSVALLVVVVDWTDSRGRLRYGQSSRYLSLLEPGATVSVSVKPSVMKLPTRDSAPVLMAGLGTGLAPFRAFVQVRARQKAEGRDIGPMFLFLGSRHQREEYLYGEEWEAYLAAGVVTFIGAAFSRDQPQKIYIQDRMRESLDKIMQAYLRDGGSFYLCGPTWPVADVTQVLKEAIAEEARIAGTKVDPDKEIDRLKEEARYVLEVYD